MHGLINRSLQCFLRDSFGADPWREIAVAAQVPAEGFEPMLHYDDAVTLRLIAAAAATLERDGESLLEDLGTYLVSHPNREALRRLLRFGGVGFADFLDSIDDLPGRARLAVPDLELPQLELSDDGPGRYRLSCRSAQDGFAAVLVGVLRAMADDYGALVMIEHLGRDGTEDCIAIELLEHDFAEGRRFDLSSPRAAAPPDPSGPDPLHAAPPVTGAATAELPMPADAMPAAAMTGAAMHRAALTGTIITDATAAGGVSTESPAANATALVPRSTDPAATGSAETSVPEPGATGMGSLPKGVAQTPSRESGATESVENTTGPHMLSLSRPSPVTPGAAPHSPLPPGRPTTAELNTPPDTDRHIPLAPLAAEAPPRHPAPASCRLAPRGLK